MIKVSDEFRKALDDENRNFSGSCTVTLTDGQVIQINDGDILEGGFKFDEATSNSGTFDVGSAIAKKFTLSLNNYYGNFSDLDFTGAEVSDIGISLSIPSGKNETIEKGIFTVSDTTYDNGEITLECLDNMHKFDKAYKNSTLTYPATLLQIVQDACKCCDAVLATDSLQFEYYDYIIKERPDDESITFRDVLTWVGQISGHFWKCNAKGQLAAGWYDMDALEKDKNVHTFGLGSITDVTADTDDVVITCVKVVTEDANMNQITVQSGTDGYACVIDGNKFITSENASEVVDIMGERIVGLRFRPLSASILQDPTVEAGDGAVVYDTETLSYKTFITNVVFSLDDDTQLSNDAESALRNSSERFSEATKIYQSLKSHIKRNKTEWEKAYEELKKGMDSKSGLYPVLQTMDDGSTVLNFCNTPALEDATVVVRLNAEGWGMSTDGGKTWNIGALVDGTVIAKILDAIGINANWVDAGTMLADRIKGGILSLGGSEDVNGIANIYDESGKLRTIIDKSGISNYDYGIHEFIPYHYRTEHCEVTIEQSDFVGGGTAVCTASMEYLILKETALSAEFAAYVQGYDNGNAKVIASIKSIVSPGTPSSNGVYALGTFGVGEVKFYKDDMKSLCMSVKVECSYINYGFNNMSPRYLPPTSLTLNIDIVY